MSESPEEDSPQGFGIPIPRELIRKVIEDHDKVHMRKEDLVNRVNAFLDGLDAEGLYAMRIILNQHNDGQTMNEFYDGVVSTLLRVKMNLDPEGVWHTKPTGLADLLGQPDV